MQQHQPGAMGKGGRPAWLTEAHDFVRRCAHKSFGSGRPEQIETREEMSGSKIVRIIAESRLDLTVPSDIRGKVRSVFVKANTVSTIRDEAIVDTKTAGLVLVVTFKEPQNGIRGLPVSKADTNKQMKCGFTHFTLARVPKEARVKESLAAALAGRYDESGYTLTFYKPKSGHRHAGEKGGDQVERFQNELFALQYLFENGLDSLYNLTLLKSWGFLPMSDEMREEENTITSSLAAVFGRGRAGQLYDESTYHGVRLLNHFRTLLADRGLQPYELVDQSMERFDKTVIAKRQQRSVEQGTAEKYAYYLSQDGRLAYTIHNGRRGQYVIKINLEAKTCTAGLAKTNVDGLTLMNLYDDFLISNRFREISHDTFVLITSAIGPLKAGEME